MVPRRGSVSFAFTLVELLVVIAIITILASLAMPVAIRGLAHAASARCKSNLHQLGAGVITYAERNDGLLPTHDDNDGDSRVIADGLWWLMAQGRILLVLRDIGIFHCPEDDGVVSTPGGTRWWSYTFNTVGPGNLRYKSVTTLKHPVKSIIFLDGIEGDGGTEGNDDRAYQPGGWTTYAAAYRRHMDGFNVLFLDSHVGYFKIGGTEPENYVW